MSSIFDGIGNDGVEQLDENLRKWFKEKWVRFGPDGKIRGACARGDDSEGKPKCLPQKKAQNLGKKGRKYAASKKRREDPNPERRGKAKNVATKKKTNEGVPFDECPKCRGPIVHESMMNEKQDACYHKVKSRYKVWPSAYASGALVQCRKKGASNWGTGGKKNESNVMKGIVDEAGSPAQQAAIAINMKKKGQKPKNVTESLLTEGKVLLEGRVVRKLWESAGQKIVEAQLTPQQIQQIFQAAEQGQTTAGGNRTIAGKGVDAASAVNRAWEDLKTKIQNTGPIQNMDAMYDKAAEALKNATGGDQGAMQYVQKYRDFAKKHPVAQSFLYAALIAAAGLSGAGAGGAAALGLLKMTDKLLQGQKFSSAAYSGAKTGGLAYAAGQLGQQMKGADAAQPVQPTQPVQVDSTDGFDADAIYRDLSGADVADPTDGFDADAIYRDLSGADVADPTSSLPKSGPDFKNVSSMVEPDQIDKAATAAKSAAKNAADAASDFTQNDMFNSVAKEIKGKVVDMDPNGAWAKLANGKIVDPDFPMDASSNNDAIAAYKLLNKTNEGVQLSKYQVFNVMEAAVMYQTALNEGIMSSIKGAAGKAAQWAKTKGHNVTTKITADKLMQAWKKAGSPTDSEKVKAVLKTAGIADQIIASVMPVQSTMKATSQPTVPAKPQAPAASAAPAQAAQPASAIGQGIAKSPQANVNPELYNRLAARKAGKPVYAGGLEEAKAKPYVKPFYENGKQVGWKSSDGYHVKYWQMFAKDSAIKHAKLNPDEVQEDYTGEFAAEKTPAINPYGGLKDNQFRGAISETPTDNPTGASGEGGLRKYRPKPAGEIDEAKKSEFRQKSEQQQYDKLEKINNSSLPHWAKEYLTLLNDPKSKVFKAAYYSFPKGQAAREEAAQYIMNKYKVPKEWMDKVKRGEMAHMAMDRPEDRKFDFDVPSMHEDTAYAGGMGQGGNAGESYRKFKPKSAGTFKEDELDEACWKGYHKEGNKKMFGKTYPNCVKNTNEEEQLDESFMQVSRINRVLKKHGFELYNDNMQGDHDNSVIRAEWHHPSGRKISTFTPNVGGGLLGNTYPSTYISVKLHGNGGMDEYKESTAEFLPTSPRELNRYLSSNNSSKVELDEKCWDTHKQVGMKNKGGRQVPNCVPKESAIMKGLKSL